MLIAGYLIQEVLWTSVNTLMVAGQLNFIEGFGKALWIIYKLFLILVVSNLKIYILIRFLSMGFRYRKYFPMLDGQMGVLIVSLV